MLEVRVTEIIECVSCCIPIDDGKAFGDIVSVLPSHGRKIGSRPALRCPILAARAAPRRPDSPELVVPSEALGRQATGLTALAPPLRQRRLGHCALIALLPGE